MSNRIRIDITRWLEQVYEKEKPDERHEHQEYLDDLKTLLYELERCYELIDQAKANLKELFEVLLSGEVQDMVDYLEGGASE